MLDLITFGHPAFNQSTPEVFRKFPWVGEEPQQSDVQYCSVFKLKFGL
jgi:hypothetical protein